MQILGKALRTLHRDLHYYKYLFCGAIPCVLFASLVLCFVGVVLMSLWQICHISVVCLRHNRETIDDYAKETTKAAAAAVATTQSSSNNDPAATEAAHDTATAADEAEDE
jgi:hypothetical protein